MVYQFNSGVLFIVKTSCKLVAIDKNIDALRLEVLEVIEFQILA
jgi:hypothetical protein